MKPADKADWSYLAALFDGEGTFSIWTHQGVSSSGKDYDSTGFRISVCNTNQRLMDWLIEKFGGVYYSHRRAVATHKTAYDWRPKGRKNTEAVLLGILPYLKIKKEQAKLSLAYVRLPHNNGSSELAEFGVKRRALMQKMQNLNQRGSSVTTNTLDGSNFELKIESELAGDSKSGPVVIQDS